MGDFHCVLDIQLVVTNVYIKWIQLSTFGISGWLTQGRAAYS